MVKLSVKKLRIIKTINLYIGSIASGMAMAVIGPTLLDLQNVVRTDTKTIGFVYTARSNGYLFGSLFGGVLFDMTPRKQFLMTMFNIVSCVSMVATPWSRKIGVLTTWMVLNGATLGAIDTGLNVCILNLWGKESGPYYQALHFAYGLGSLISPLIAAPFLDPSLISPASTNTTSLNLAFQNTTSSLISTSPLNTSFPQTGSTSIPTFTTNAIPSVTYVFSIIGLTLLVVTVLFFVTCLVAPFDSGPKGSDEKTLPRSKVFVVGVVFLNFLLVFVDTGTEVGYAQMLTTYAVKGPLKLSTTTGSYMTSSFWGAFTLGRFASIFLAIRFSSLSLLVGDIVLTSAGAIFLHLLAPTHEWALWVASRLLGAGIASFFPSAVAWVERYINVTNKIVAIFATGAAFGEMIIPFTISSYIEEVPEVVSYVVIATCVLCALCTLAMYSIFRRTQEKYVTEKEGGQENIAVATIS